MISLIHELNALALEVATLAEKAGQEIVLLYKEDVKVIEKQDGSPVTCADRASHRILKAGLEKLEPQVPIISEEDEDSWTIKSPYYWLIDPLDGTKGFIRKSGDFCVSIALMENNHPIMGLIHIPLTGETFYGYENKAFRLHNGKTTPLHTRNYPKEGVTLLVGRYGKEYEEEAHHLKDFSINDVKEIRSAIKFCHIAAGRADLYFRLEPCSEWDTAAGQLLLEAAGGIMKTLDGKPFLYGKPGLKNESFIAFGKKR